MNEELLAEERAEFEVECYLHYTMRKAAGKIDLSQAGEGTPESLFWRQPNGEYGVLGFNAAWWGWRAAKGLLPSPQ
jgi:hypothetical protein